MSEFQQGAEAMQKEVIQLLDRLASKAWGEGYRSDSAAYNAALAMVDSINAALIEKRMMEGSVKR